jgi:hypothetical protein
VSLPPDSEADPAYTRPDPRRRPARKRLPPEDPRPFVDRYRGTQWDLSGRMRRPRTRRRRLLALPWPNLMGGLAVVVAVAVAGAWTMVGLRRPTGLSIFGELTPAPAQVALGPSASTPPATGWPTDEPAIPQTWRAGSEHPAARFIALMNRPDVSFRINSTVAIAAPIRAGTLVYAMKVSGADYSTVIELTSPSLDLRVRTVVKNGRWYGRVEDGQWTRGQGDPPPANPFGDLTAESYDRLEYVGQEWVNGRLLHHVRLPVLHLPGPADRALAIVTAPPVFRWDVWVDADGQPRSARTTVDVTVRAGGRDVLMTLDFDYRISRFDRKVRITVPAPFRG